MIYADPSFLASLYGWDGNTKTAQNVHAADARRPLCLTPWQRFEVRNALRLAIHKLKRAGLSAPFQTGSAFKRMDEDLSTGRLKHQDPDWRETFRLAEDFSSQHTETLGTASVDLWHVSAAAILGADTFWTFDENQQRLAAAVGKFKRVPKLPSA